MARPANKRRKSTAANKENEASGDNRASRTPGGARCLPVANFAELPFDILLEVSNICVSRVFFAQNHLDWYPPYAA